MSTTAALLIILSAFMHAGWNFVSKRNNPSLAFFAIAAMSASIVSSVFLFRYSEVLGAVSGTVWLLVALTGVAQLIYMFGLAGAYRLGDISLAYPLARALPVLMIAGISFLRGNSAEISPFSLTGMLLIAIGCIILPLQNFKQIRLANYRNTVCLMALIAAIGTTGYTTIDDQAQRLLRNAINLNATQITLLYIAFQTTSTAIVIGLVSLIHQPERQKLLAIINNRSALTTGLVTGIIIMATYGLAMAAMAYVTDVSYVGAFRQLSIPIGAILGIVIQKEPRPMPKLLGIAIITIGLILVGFG